MAYTIIELFICPLPINSNILPLGPRYNPHLMRWLDIVHFKEKSQPVRLHRCTTDRMDALRVQRRPRESTRDLHPLYRVTLVKATCETVVGRRMQCKFLKICCLNVGFQKWQWLNIVLMPDVDWNEALTEGLRCAVKRHPVLPKTNLANKITGWTAKPSKSPAHQPPELWCSS